MTTDTYNSAENDYRDKRCLDCEAALREILALPSYYTYPCRCEKHVADETGYNRGLNQCRHIARRALGEPK